MKTPFDRLRLYLVVIPLPTYYNLWIGSIF